MLRTVSTNNPNSPINLYSNITSSGIKIRSVQALSENTLQVRFDAWYAASNYTKRISKIATVNYEYRNLKLKEEERFINPLGFTVTYYRVDDEL